MVITDVFDKSGKVIGKNMTTQAISAQKSLITLGNESTNVGGIINKSAQRGAKGLESINKGSETASKGLVKLTTYLS